MTKTSKPLPQIVSAQEWQVAMEQHTLKEKALTRARDVLHAERRKLPMVKVERNYSFDGESGEVDFSELFAGRQQLIVYHFMFAPEWEAGCSGCSWVVDAMTHPAQINLCSIKPVWAGIIRFRGTRLMAAILTMILVPALMRTRYTVPAYLSVMAMIYTARFTRAGAVLKLSAVFGLILI